MEYFGLVIWQCNLDVGHSAHVYPWAGHNYRCPGLPPQPPQPAELPVETELIDGAWYTDGKLTTTAKKVRLLTDQTGWIRLSPVARYEPPPAPETPEPTGIGAVVLTADGQHYVRAGGAPIFNNWSNVRTAGRAVWGNLKQPVEVLSEGVEL